MVSGTLGAGLILLAVANLVVSVAVVRSPLFEPAQAWAQVALIWLVPVIGAVIVTVFMRSQREGAGPRRTSENSGDAGGPGPENLDHGGPP